MLRLDLSNEPRWLELAPGVRLLLRPIDLDLMADAEEDADLSALRARISGSEPTDPERRALGRALMLAIMRVAVLAWEGVCDAEGNPIDKPWREGIDALMRHPHAFAPLHEQYLAPAMMVVAEGNGSASGRAGTTAVVPGTAGRARLAAKPARSAKPPRKR